jgi:hypothetical protein
MLLLLISLLGFFAKLFFKLSTNSGAILLVILAGVLSAIVDLAIRCLHVVTPDKLNFYVSLCGPNDAQFYESYAAVESTPPLSLLISKYTH